MDTLLMRLEGPMQSWGTSSRLQLRRTDLFPSKSGVLGILLCAMGITRENSRPALKKLNELRMGVRIDRKGHTEWDYHSAGAKIGIRKAEGGIKNTASTGEFETLLSRRQYLFDASFLVALQGEDKLIKECSEALESPVWPIYFGRKCCIPSRPVFYCTGDYQSLEQALSSKPYLARPGEYLPSPLILETYTEHAPGKEIPEKAVEVFDVPQVFGFFGYSSRWITPGQVEAEIERPSYNFYERKFFNPEYYNTPHWKKVRKERLEYDSYLCVFCKSPAVDVHHVDYSNTGNEKIEDLRSLCKLCHDACTMLEYGGAAKGERVDPTDPSQREAILDQVKLILHSTSYSRKPAMTIKEA